MNKLVDKYALYKKKLHCVKKSTVQTGSRQWTVLCLCLRIDTGYRAQSSVIDWVMRMAQKFGPHIVQK